MKKNVFKVLLIALVAVVGIVTFSVTSVNAQSVYDEYALETTIDDYEYSLEEMLVLAIQDEFLAKAEYEAIINEFGEVKPFINIVRAEQTHIDLLLPLFEAYGIAVPVNTASDNVVIPESITSALATGVDAEEANIAMYQAFLSQDNLPDDVRAAFEYLLNASEHHLQAFSQDRYAYYGTDMANQIKNQFRKMFQNGNGESRGNQYKGSRGNASGSQNANDGVCPNA